MRRARALALLIPLFFTVACGKKGDPQPPFPRGPIAVSDLSVEQEGDEAVLTFTFPDRLLTGAPLTDLDSVEVYRILRPSPTLTEPRAVTGGAATGGTGTVQVPGTAARRRATGVRLAEEGFYREAGDPAAALPTASLADYTRGATIVYRDDLAPILREGKGPVPVAWAVVSVRRNGERSPLSNIASLTPDVAPEAPVITGATAEQGRVCLEWQAADKDLLGRPVEVGGYNVYRRALPQQVYDRPLNSKPVPGTTYIDAGAPYGVTLVYTLRATLASNAKVEGLPAEEVGFTYRDVYSPPPPLRLEALSEGNLVRLHWDPVDAPDLAGYLVFRADATGEPARLTLEPLTDPIFKDETVAPGTRYRYTVRSVDRAGNLSAPSSEAVAEPY